ncbi:MAG: aminoacyl-tRNA hydrolase, partial [Verrucomicrobia bacterium]|nr:aminoacyl-tRNA hydrolase [Verrucomicrobiota bacterium]
RTRHNAGFLLADRLAGRWQAAWKSVARFKTRVARVTRQGRRLVLSQPQTFMNDSGAAVRALADYYRVSTSRLLVLVDDADLPLGEIRLRGRGSSGGHHGLESIEAQLGTRDYPRLRLGIGRRADGAREITDFVLGRFAAAENDRLDAVLERAADQVECWLTAGLEIAMSRFNGMTEETV